ncbi:MAG TPA: outer membrane protein assembly factor BamA, partial [Acetobacteraceae bacterium]|nr:outer membrane protein assembly factor BamA [Acetobacteraceae bacterium]
MQLRSVTRHLAACLLMICVTAAATAQPSVAPPPAAPPASGPLPSAPGPSAPGPSATAPASAPASAPLPIPHPVPLPALAGGAIQAIQVVGNERIEAGTIRSYLVVRPGDPFDPDRLDRSVKTLFSTGLFKNVQLSRQGNVLIVNVEENPLVNKVAIEGNKRLSDDQIKPEIQTKPRAVFTPAMVEADRQKILDLYVKKGNFDATVTPQIIRQDQNRVDVVFQVAEGPTAYISKIAIVGNHAFSESKLIDAISSREERWWRFLSTSDQYDPERLQYDKELLRRFYLKNGYADIDILNATAELSPDRQGFFVTFTVHEGERYHLGKVTATSQIKGITPDELLGAIDLREGDWYDGDAVGKADDAMQDYVHNRGYAFVEVRPRVKKNDTDHTIDMLFDVGEGPRVYIER